MIEIKVDYSQINKMFIPAVEKSLETMSKKAENAGKEACEEYLPTLKKKIEDIYKDAVDEFYDSYVPLFYESNGKRENMYSIFHLDDGSSGNSISLHPRVDENIPGRDGFNVFETVFEDGYHGGASAGYQGALRMYRGPLYKWTHWTREAVYTEPTPDIYNRMIEERTSEFESELETILYKKMESIGFFR